MGEIGIAKNSRVVWIDYLKAIGIFFVVLGHVVVPKEMKAYIYSFHMPLFFLLSGMTVKPLKYSNISDVAINKFKQLIIPYIAINLSTITCWIILKMVLMGDSVSVRKLIMGIIYSNSDEIFLVNGPTWFLTTLFLCHILFYLIYKISKGDNTNILIFGLICMVLAGVDSLGVKLYGIEYFSPWHFTSVPMGTFFLIAGYLIFHNIESLSVEGKWKPIIIVILFGIGYYLVTKNGKISLGGNKYRSMIVTLCSAFSTIFAWMYLVQYIKPIKILSFIGNNTLLILALHKPIFQYAKYFWPEVIKNNENAIWIAFVIFITTIPLSYLINRYIPFIIGNIKKTKLNITAMVIYSVITIGLMIYAI